jgi:hypothetical protein
MFRPDLDHWDDDALIAARSAAEDVLFGAVQRILGPDAGEHDLTAGVIAAWSFAHGFANLWSGGHIPSPPGALAEDVAREARQRSRAW